MPQYYITAKRETLYNFEFWADSEEEAIAEVNRIELSDEDVETYAYDWYPLEITDIEELEENE
jgi:hypothetical protein